MKKALLARSRTEFAVRAIDRAQVADADQYVWPRRGLLLAGGLALGLAGGFAALGDRKPQQIRNPRTGQARQLIDESSSLLLADPATKSMGLTSERGAFLRSASINVVGQMAPLIAAVITIPPLLSVLGADRFGLLMLFMVAVGYFGLLDIGIAKAVTRRIAQLGVEAGPADRSVIIGSALLLLLAISLLTAGFLFAMSGQIVSAVGATPELSAELQGALRLVALCIPIILMGQAFRGCLEGLNRFDLVNLITVPASVATYVLAYGGAFLGADLRYVVMGVCLSRVLGAIAFLAAYRALHTGPQVKLAASKSEATQLLRFGGWAGVRRSSVRLSFSWTALRSRFCWVRSAAAIYSTVQEIMYRILIVPSAVTAVTFLHTFALLGMTARERRTSSRRAFWLYFSFSLR